MIPAGARTFPKGKADWEKNWRLSDWAWGNPGHLPWRGPRRRHAGPDDQNASGFSTRLFQHIAPQPTGTAYRFPCAPAGQCRAGVQHRRAPVQFDEKTDHNFTRSLLLTMSRSDHRTAPHTAIPAGHQRELGQTGVAVSCTTQRSSRAHGDLTTTQPRDKFTDWFQDASSQLRPSTT